MEYDDEMIDKIATVAVEKILNRMPDVIGNLMMNHATMHKLNKEFYAKYPEFASNKNLVTSVIEQVEGEDLTLPYKEILDKSVPKIKERLGTIEGLDLKNKSGPVKRDISFNTVDNGIL